MIKIEKKSIKYYPICKNKNKYIKGVKLMEKNKNIKKGYLLILITVIIWGMDNVLLKSLLNEQIPSTLLIYLRFIFATLVVSIILKIKKESYNKEIINPKYKRLIIIMACTLSIFYFLQVNGLNITKAVLSEFIGTTMTTISTIVILSIFIKSERKQILNKYTLLALIISITGTFFTTLGDLNFGLDFGVILIIIADIFWGFYTMTYLKIDEKISAMRVNRDLGIVAIVIYTVILLITNQFGEIFNIGIVNIFKILVFSVLMDVGTIVTYYVAIRIISGVKCSIITLACPIISFTLSYFWLGERITFMQFGGCVLLFISSILLVVKDYRESKIENKKVLEEENEYNK